MHHRGTVCRIVALFGLGLLTTGCVEQGRRIHAGDPLQRAGDEIVACGQLFHTGAPVVLWMDAGGYDAYRVERRFVPMDESGWDATSEHLSSPNRYGLRRSGLTDEEIEEVRGGGWDLDLLRDVVDQFVLHYDACGTSQRCFRILHDRRGLSVHFMLDVDGTIYQTLDCKERAWHATSSNDRSVGIEIANIGAYDVGGDDPLDDWYATDDSGRVRMTIPPKMGAESIRTPDFVPRPARNEVIVGSIQGRPLRQYDLTPQQYESLIKLAATLCRVFPKIKPDAPRDDHGDIVLHKLDDERLEEYGGILGHFHIQKNKVDPGPAMQWERLIRETNELLDKAGPLPAGY